MECNNNNKQLVNGLLNISNIVPLRQLLVNEVCSPYVNSWFPTWRFDRQCSDLRPCEWYPLDAAARTLHMHQKLTSRLQTVKNNFDLEWTASRTIMLTSGGGAHLTGG